MAEDSWQKSRYVLWSIIITAALLLSGLGLFWLAASLQESTVLSAFLSGIASALVTLGMLEIFYEAILKRALVQDMRESSRLESDIYDVGLSKVAMERDAVKKIEVFESARSIDIAPLHPLTWLDREAHWLVTLARQQPIKCRIHLPEPNSYSEILRYLESDDRELSTSHFCNAKFRQYMNIWDRHDKDFSASSLEVLYYAGYPQAGYVVSESAAVIDIGIAKLHNTDYISYIYKGQSARTSISRIKQFVDRLGSVSIAGSAEDNRPAEDILPLQTGSPSVTAAGGHIEFQYGVGIDARFRGQE